jgi:hypothetical protein
VGTRITLKACTENPFGLVSVHCYIPTGFAVYVFCLKTAVSRVSWTVTENICFPSPQQTGGGRLKTSKTVDSPRLGRLSVLVLSAYVGNLDVSLLRAEMKRLGVSNAPGFSAMVNEQGRNNTAVFSTPGTSSVRAV